MTPVPPQQSAERQLEEARVENARLNGALRMYADPANWTVGSIFDPNSAAFVGITYAERSLAYAARARTTLSEAKTHG